MRGHGRWARKTLGATGGRATKRCRRRIATTVCDLGARREHLWAFRRGATTQAISSQPTWPERETREKQHVAWRAVRSRTARVGPRCARRPTATPQARRAMGDGGQPGNEASPAENRHNGFRLGRGAQASLDIVAGRNNAGHNFANKSKTGAIESQRAGRGMARVGLTSGTARQHPA